jgi:hypothetical protein
MKLLFANCEKSVSLEPPQWVEMAHDNRDNERPERTRGVVRGEYGVGSSAGALYRNWCPHWQPAEQAHVELGKPPHRLRRQPRLNRLRPEVIPTTRIPRHGHLCLLGVLSGRWPGGCRSPYSGRPPHPFFRCLSASTGCRRNL